MRLTTSLFAAAVVLLIAGCSTTNTTLGNLQINQEAIPFPDNYREAAIDAVKGKPTIGPLTVSSPQQIVGEGINDPKRWYICVRGLDPGNAKPGRKPVLDLSDMVDPPAATNVFDAIIVFNKFGAGATKLVFDAPLCRHVEFEAL